MILSLNVCEGSNIVPAILRIRASWDQNKFVSTNYQRFKDIFMSKREKIPKAVAGLDGVYSLKRLAEK